MTKGLLLLYLGLHLLLGPCKMPQVVRGGPQGDTWEAGNNELIRLRGEMTRLSE